MDLSNEGKTRVRVRSDARELNELKLKFGVVAVGKCCDILGEHKLLQRSTVEWRGRTRAVKPDDYCKLPRE